MPVAIVDHSLSVDHLQGVALIRWSPQGINARAAGAVWPGAGSDARTPGDAIADVFGPRPFAAHIPTVGYDYDFHRGVDVDLDVGDVVRSVIGGACIRASQSHFGWQVAGQLDFWNEVDPEAILTASIDTGNAELDIDIDAGAPGLILFQNTPRIERAAQPIQVDDDWIIEFQIVSPTVGTAGNAIGIAVVDFLTNQNVRLQTDGIDILAKGNDSGGALAGGSLGDTGQEWFRIEQNSGTVTFRTSTDGESWSTFQTETPSWTNTTRPVFVPWIYYDWQASGVESFQVKQCNYVDASTIGRFGNWAMVCDGDRRVAIMHCRELTLEKGDIVAPGDQLGTIGQTGFDTRSGRIQSAHAHVELLPGNSYFYDNDDPINPLDPSLLPRVNVSNNVAAVLTEENDPNSDASWRLEITVTRADEDFDFNSVTLTTTGATRTVNFDSRAGLDADPDVPDHDGVYIVASSFNAASASYVVDLYFDKAVLTGTLSSWSVEDTEGNTLASG